MVETTIQPSHGPHHEGILLLGREEKLTNSDILVVPVPILRGLRGKGYLSLILGSSVILGLQFTTLVK